MLSALPESLREDPLALRALCGGFADGAGWAVRLELHVRRFFCQNKECLRQIFTERLPSVVAPYARRTTRLTELFTLIGFADGEGKPASGWLMEWGERPVLIRSCG